VNCRIDLSEIKSRLRRLGGLRAALARRPRPPVSNTWILAVGLTPQRVVQSVPSTGTKSAGDEGRGQRCHVSHGPQGSGAKGLEPVRSFISAGSGCSCASLEMLGYNQPGDPHVHGVAGCASATKTPISHKYAFSGPKFISMSIQTGASFLHWAWKPRPRPLDL
jgi:hypothetical protein